MKFFVTHFIYSMAVSSFLSTYVIFMQSKGMSFTEINGIEAIFMVSVFVLEIPTGVIADWYGRKVSFLLSAVARAGAMLLYMTSPSFNFFAIAAAAAAFAETCHTGAFESWVIEGLRKINPQLNLEKTFAKLIQLGSVASIIGGLGGAILAEKELKLV